MGTFSIFSRIVFLCEHGTNELKFAGTVTATHRCSGVQLDRRERGKVARTSSPPSSHLRPSISPPFAPDAGAVRLAPPAGNYLLLRTEKVQWNNSDSSLSVADSRGSLEFLADDATDRQALIPILETRHWSLEFDQREAGEIVTFRLGRFLSSILIFNGDAHVEEVPNGLFGNTLEVMLRECRR